MSNMEIRMYQQTDERALQVFKEQVWPNADVEHYGDNLPSFFKEELTFIAEENGAIVGYSTMIADSGVAQIEPLMVAVDRKGQGIGSALLVAVEAKAKQMGIHKLWLETGSDWKAKHFYEKSGFAVRSVLPNHIGGREFVLMDKMI